MKCVQTGCEFNNLRGSDFCRLHQRVDFKTLQKDPESADFKYVQPVSYFKHDVYLMGSLRNPRIPVVADQLRGLGLAVFDEWHAAGPGADDAWQAYEQMRGHTYEQALAGYPACHVFEYDKTHVDASRIGVLLLPAGKSGHLELGYMLGKGKPGYIVYEGAVERYDVMYKFATRVFGNVDDLFRVLEKR